MLATRWPSSSFHSHILFPTDFVPPTKPIMNLNSIFGTTTSLRAVKLFEIRLDKSILVFSGTPDEAAGQVLKGSVVLCTSEPLNVKNIKLELSGKCRVAWPELIHSQSRSRFVKHESVVCQHEWNIVGKAQTFGANNYEWPFEVVIPGGTPESVEGLVYSWVVYRMKATIGRGTFGRDILANKHVRIVRTLDPTALDLSHAMSIDNIWVDKIEYTISVPSKAAILGTSITADFKFIPLLKGLRIGRIRLELMEVQDFKVPVVWSTHRESRQIVAANFELDEDTESSNDEAGQECFEFSRSMRLPTSLRECMQDVDSQGLKIRHHLKFSVSLLNPDGHKSELKATLPVRIFISPHMDIDEANNLINPNIYRNQILRLQDHAPPLYGEHHFDPLWNDIDPSGFMTPAGGFSATGTPLGSQSRSQSFDNLGALNAASTAHGSAHPLALQQRLSNLPEHPSASPQAARDPPRARLSALDGDAPISHDAQAQSHQVSPTQDDYFARSRASSGGEGELGLSRRASGTDSPPTQPQHIEYDVEELSRVPSYSTALRSAAGTPFHQSLPNYETATSLPPSPLHHPAHHA